jgi:hypothetical protein
MFLLASSQNGDKVQRRLDAIGQALKIALLLSMVGLMVYQDSPPPGAVETQINRLIAGQTFDYVGWELTAAFAKGAQIFAPVQDYMPDSTRKELVLRYMDLIRQAAEQAQKINEIYGDARVADPAAASANYRAEYRRRRAELNQMQATVESIIEDQVAAGLAEQGLAIGGQIVPPVKFRFTPLPQQLIVSPRGEIRQLYSFSLETDFTVDRAEALEKDIDRRFDVSSLVVPIGGMGLYPTMLLETDSLEWTIKVVAHEWAHNWLTLFPVGWHYATTPELRTINETAASIVENEVGPLVLARFYPELSRPPEPAAAPDRSNPPEPPPFDFRHAMRLTRLEVDRLLQENKIADAEAYMEARRQVFWAQGYHIRKLNQAYFAFYGVYADEPGASGQDPVGPMVVLLRQRNASLKDFLFKLTLLTSFDALKQAVND